MAQQALGTGSTGRRRAMFGLLDRDGWSWAFLKALAWFVFIIFLMGYLPDRAYYFTVFSTIDLGIRSDALTPVNFCPPDNQTLPCPAPAGAILPWQVSPAELALPAGRRDGVTVQVGTHLLYIGGTDGTAAVSSVYVADLYSTGNFSAWRKGPDLPEARTRPAAGFFSGSVYVIGGADASGKPSTSVWFLTPDAKTGELASWEVADGGTEADGKTKRPSLALPEGRSGAAFVAAGDGIVLVGGRNPSGPVATVWKATVNATGVLQAWAPQAPMVQPRADEAAILLGSSIFVYGGVDASGPTSTVQRGDLTTDASQVTHVSRWGTPTNAGANLPAPRADAASFTANGALYLIGGTDGTTPSREVWWTTPDASGAISSWKHLTQSDLATPLVGGSAISSGAEAFIVGGQSTSGIAAGSERANLAPKPPFFQLGGPFGATVPALKIDGEVGQQIGYLAAAGVGTGNFVLLLVIGWVNAHQEQTKAMIARLRNRRRH
ncbi:MAG TPA: hypothetical protein VK656_05675 [Candidatus Acidoferrum sp.]|nr:hypothetical protein [Candidatus Acidoferrum sp.]